MKKKVAVLLGGKSAEREISLKTGEAVYKALTEKGYHAIKIDAAVAPEVLVGNLIEFKPDLVFIALHGKYGEDGVIQGMLEALGIPYTGCGVLASSLAMNKIYTKKILCYEGIPTADFLEISKQDLTKEGMDSITNKISERLGYPVVIKAPTQGSTIGVYFVHRKEEVPPAIEGAFQYDPIIMAEKFITGTEITVSVLGNEEPFALPTLEIVSKTGVYDYEAKYTVGLSEHIIPARVTPECRKLVSDLALKTYKALDCKGFARVDFIVDADEKPYVLEINTIPGMTETSLLPDAAKAADIEFPDLVELIVNYGLGIEK